MAAPRPFDASYTLDHKYALAAGRVYLTGVQALVRLPLDQARRDRAAGLKTAGYVTGYRGSPITTLDAQLWAAGKILDEHDIRFEPGLNEELAATSLRGTQELQWFGKSPYEGVFALWYAKGVGVDRACEALKLANFEGAAAKGGVLVVAGDDHAAKSSTLPHQSDHVFAAAVIPVLNPASVQDYLDLGIHGWAMSRYSGCWVGFKAVTDTVESTAVVDVGLERVRYLRSTRDVVGSSEHCAVKQGLLGPQWQRPELYDLIYPRPLREAAE